MKILRPYSVFSICLEDAETAMKDLNGVFLPHFWLYRCKDCLIFRFQRMVHQRRRLRDKVDNNLCVTTHKLLAFTRVIRNIHHFLHQKINVNTGWTSHYPLTSLYFHQSSTFSQSGCRFQTFHHFLFYYQIRKQSGSKYVRSSHNV